MMRRGDQCLALALRKGDLAPAALAFRLLRRDGGRHRETGFVVEEQGVELPEPPSVGPPKGIWPGLTLTLCQAAGSESQEEGAQ